MNISLFRNIFSKFVKIRLHSRNQLPSLLRTALTVTLRLKLHHPGGGGGGGEMIQNNSHFSPIWVEIRLHT